MSWRFLILWSLVALCFGLVRLVIIDSVSLATSAALLIIVVAATLLLLPVARRWPTPTCFATAAGTLVAGLVGWFVVLPLVFLLLLIPFPQRRALIGTWTTTEGGATPAVYQRTFSPFGTSTTSINGAVSSTGHYLFLDDRTIQIERWHVPSQFTVGPQLDLYILQIEGDTLTLTWTLTHKTTVYHR